LDLEHLVLEVATKEPGQQRPEAWVVVEVIGEAVALHGDALLDNIAEMDADAEFDGSLGRQAGVAHDHAVLDLDCAPHLVDHTAKFDEEPVAGALDHAPMMGGGRTLGSINPWKRRGRQRAQMPVPRRSEVRVRKSRGGFVWLGLICLWSGVEKFDAD
jgi:hypothetical protein